MQHMTLKAVTTATDQGAFEAVISTEAVDRENDVVVATAMVDALRAWTLNGKLIPLAYNHSTAAEDIIGHVKPSTVKAVGSEVVAEGGSTSPLIAAGMSGDSPSHRHWASASATSSPRATRAPTARASSPAWTSSRSARPRPR
jgi:hypothetical protein